MFLLKRFFIKKKIKNELILKLEFTRSKSYTKTLYFNFKLL